MRQYPIVSLEDGLSEGRLGRLEESDRRARRQDSTRRRRHLRHQHSDLQRGIDEGSRQLDPDQAESDWHGQRDAGRDRSSAPQRLYVGDLASLRRNRRHVHRRPCRCHGRGTDQDRLSFAHRPHCQVQPVAAHRRGVGFVSAISGAEGVELQRMKAVIFEVVECV